MSNKNNNPNPNQTEEREEQTRKRVKRIVTIILIIVLIVIILLLLRSCGNGHIDDIAPTQPTIGTDLPIDPDAGEYIPPETKAPSQGVAIPGWGTLTIPANTTEDIIVDFYNPELNKDLYYLTFELWIPNENGDGYETLYKSGLIEPGKHIQKITLNRGLPAGNYDAIIHVQPYRMDEYKSPTNNADLKTELIVR